MTNLNPTDIFNEFKDGKIDKATAANYLVSIIENHQDPGFKINAIKILGEMGARKNGVFELLENLFISEWHFSVKNAKEIVQELRNN